MKTSKKTSNFIIVAALALCFFACKKNVQPTVTIDNSISASYTSANVTGTVTDEGGTPVTDRGFIYGKQGDAKQDTAYCGSGGGEFPTRLTNLEPGSIYSCMAFATNSAGTAYSGKASFTTLPMAMSEVTTNVVSEIGCTTATCGGNVNSDGGSEVTERGVCWGTSQNPTTSDSHLSSGSGLGDFTVNITGLTPNTTYYVRAYSVNGKGTAYGENVTFKTYELGKPVVTTAEVSNITNITAFTATCGGKVVADGGATVTARGVCWSETNQNPTISNSHTTDGTGTGSFISNITGLTDNKTYYVRAYATNSNGTAYGATVQFTIPKSLYLISEGGTVTVSSAKFYDSGGATGNYQSNEDYVITFKPATSGKIRVTFTRFETEGINYDYLYIYDGSTTSATQIGKYGGFTSPGTVTATNSDGSLTFRWHSDYSGTKAGWEATITVVQ